MTIRPTTQMFKLFRVAAEDQRLWHVNFDQNTKNPFFEFVGNRNAISRLACFAFHALGNDKHHVAQNIAFIGPASVGKTKMAHAFAKIMSLPFVEIEPTSVNSPADILVKIAEVLEKIEVSTGTNGVADGNKTTLELIPDGNRIKLPAMILFIDEVQNMKRSAIDGLLKATEPNDRTLDTGKLIVDCSLVCWMIATTDRGDLPAPFDSRFIKIELDVFSQQEVAEIIYLNNKDWAMADCLQVARFGGRIAREALLFATEVRAQIPMGDGTVAYAIESARKLNGIDEFGLSKKRLQILMALADGPIAKARIAGIITCGMAEVENFIMPSLLATTADQKAFVAMGPRGYCLTNEGYNELAKRGIKYTRLSNVNWKN